MIQIDRKKPILCGSKQFMDRSEENVGSILKFGISEALWWIAYWNELSKLFWSKVLYFGHELENVHFAIAASACKIGPTDKRG